WAREYFGSFQVAIYYHDDNDGRIPHAHLIVNNANLERPGRVSTILTPQFEREIFQGLQRMAAERGLHAFTERATSVNNAEWAKADARRESRERPKGTVQPTYRSKQDKELEAKGMSWKRDVRDRMACAIALSNTEDEFVEACRALGLAVEWSSGKRTASEYVYAHPGSPTWRVMGRTLGRDWSTWGVQRRLARDRQRGVAKPEGSSRERLLAAIGSLSTAEGAIAMQVLGTVKGTPVTAAAVCNMLQACASMDIRSMGDFQAAMREPMPPEERSRLREALRLARALGHLPKERDRVDGRRAPYEERVGKRSRQATIPSDTARPHSASPGIAAEHEEAPTRDDTRHR
ncbi:MAG: relaxase/mobilization nuclease domain-containing protein, partial [Atopobiaceae bacterium]|nr:relaxase/mobilization nuclease domain-containing protein [Atopobiaceae bacterium]